MFCVIDTETEGLINPQKLWLVVIKEVDTGKVHVWRRLHQDPDQRRSLQAFCKNVTAVIGHNLIHFDLRVLERLAGVFFSQSQVIDTLVASRLLNQGVEGGHSLDAIGQRLGYPKTSFADFSTYSLEMEKYCVNDVEVTWRFYEKLKPFLFSPKWKDALRLEHDIAFVCREMHENGFDFDKAGAEDIHTEIVGRLQILTQELVTSFPAKPVLVKEITPRETKHGALHRQDFRWLDSNDLTPFFPGASFSRIEFQTFNPGSPKQRIERLNAAGWRPFEKTKGHLKAERDGDEEKLAHFKTYGWTCSEANLATLPEDAPEAARKLVEWLLLDSRRSTLEEWLNAYSAATGKIHGRFHHIGAWTHRMSHSGPNMANIPAGDSPYASQMRSLWQVPEGDWLVGVDADGIQLRILAHYMNDKAFTESLVNGRKEDGTDAHTLNQKALGHVCSSREVAKTFIYAWLLGAGASKIAEILNCSLGEARQAAKNFIEAYPGLKALKEEIIPRDARRGYFIGLDGRAVLCDSEHYMLAGYLQNGEAVVMKKANLIWRSKLDRLNIDYRQVNFVHDEWQTRIRGTYEDALTAANIQADAIREAGELLKVRCPLAGSILNSHKDISIGRTWSQTH